MSTERWIPSAPAPDDAWMREFTDRLRAKRPELPVFSARHMAPEAFKAMHLLTPAEAAELWDERMIATNRAWRRLAGP
jgi:hypothetical protein